MKIIDISLVLNKNTPIYPGNIPLSVSIYNSIPPYKSQISSITMGSHTGTHIDAPSHVLKDGYTLDKIPLESFVGSCRVLDFSMMSPDSVTLKMLQEKNIKKNERILLKTKNSIRGFNYFYDDYVYLSGDGADFLATLEVTLVGIDALSIKQRGSIDHRPHLSLLSKNIPILEGLDLSKVKEGEYELFCLPLNFTDIDGAPTRAILIEK